MSWITSALSTLISLASQLGIIEASKYVDNIDFNQYEASKLAQDVLIAAEKKGSAMLTKAANLISNIPVLANSPSLKQYLTNARNRAETNYKNVEQQIFDMKSKANSDASQIQSLGTKDILSKTGNYINSKLGKTSTFREQANNIKSNAINSINNVETKI